VGKWTFYGEGNQFRTGKTLILASSRPNVPAMLRNVMERPPPPRARMPSRHHTQLNRILKEESNSLCITFPAFYFLISVSRLFLIRCFFNSSPQPCARRRASYLQFHVASSGSFHSESMTITTLGKRYTTHDNFLILSLTFIRRISYRVPNLAVQIALVAS